MDAYSCTECGRCSAACPATITGKLLSPRKIMMDTRDRLELVGRNIKLNNTFSDDGKTLLHDYITVEELRACTTCNACVQECPVSISPLDIILQLRRSLVMEESNAPRNGMQCLEILKIIMPHGSLALMTGKNGRWKWKECSNQILYVKIKSLYTLVQFYILHFIFYISN